MVQQGGLDEELGERSGLDVIVVGFANPSDPTVRGAVRGDVEVEGLKEVEIVRSGFIEDKMGVRMRRPYLKNDSLSFQDLFSRVSVLGHVNELVHAAGSDHVNKASTAKVEKMERGNPPGGQDFLVFGSDEHGSDADQLKLDERDDPDGEEPVDDVDGDPKSFG